MGQSLTQVDMCLFFVQFVMLQGFYSKLNFRFSLWLSLLFIPVEILVWNLTFKSQANLGQSLTQVDMCLFFVQSVMLQGFYSKLNFRFSLWLSLLFIPVEILVWNITFKSQANLGQSFTQVHSAFFCLICYATRFLYQVKVFDFHYGCHCYLFQLKFCFGILRLSLRPTLVSPLTQVDSAFFCPISSVTRFLYQVQF